MSRVSRMRSAAIRQRPPGVSGHLAYLDEFAAQAGTDKAERLGIPARRELAAGRLRHVTSPGYIDSLVGTLGVDPSVVSF
jgi:hypothetical protein